MPPPDAPPAPPALPPPLRPPSAGLPPLPAPPLPSSSPPSRGLPAPKAAGCRGAPRPGPSTWCVGFGGVPREQLGGVCCTARQQRHTAACSQPQPNTHPPNTRPPTWARAASSVSNRSRAAAATARLHGVWVGGVWVHPIAPPLVARGLPPPLPIPLCRHPPPPHTPRDPLTPAAAAPASVAWPQAAAASWRPPPDLAARAGGRARAGRAPPLLQWGLPPPRQPP